MNSISITINGITWEVDNYHVRKLQSSRLLWNQELDYQHLGKRIIVITDKAVFLELFGHQKYGYIVVMLENKLENKVLYI